MSESSIDELVKEIDAYFNAHSMPIPVVEKQRPSVVAATTDQKASVVDDGAKRQHLKHGPETKILTSKRIRPQSVTVMSKVEDGTEELAFPKRKKLTPNAEYNILNPVLKSVENELCYTPLTQLYKMYKRQQQTNAEQDEQQEFGKNFLKSVQDDRDFYVPSSRPKWGRTQAYIDESKKADEALKKMDKEMQDDYMAWFGKPLVAVNDERESKKSI
jgi:hypothetical protein